MYTGVLKANNLNFFHEVERLSGGDEDSLNREDNLECSFEPLMLKLTQDG